MRHDLIRTGTALALALAACAKQQPLPVAAFAGIEADAQGNYALTVATGQQTVLDGSASKDPGGGTLSYEWSFVSLPAGSQAKIEQTVAAVGQANAMMYSLAFSPGLSNILDTGRGLNTPYNPNARNEMHPAIDVLDLAYRTAQAMRKNVPSTVASMTGGEYELFASRQKFEVRMNDFTNHLHNRYLLSFPPKEPAPGLHRLQVRLKNPANGTVLARTSYWAEGPGKN